MSKHTYGFPAGTDKMDAIKSALDQAVADGLIASPNEASTEILETDAHQTDAEERVVRPDGTEQVMPHAPEFVVVVRTTGPTSL